MGGGTFSGSVRPPCYKPRLPEPAKLRYFLIISDIVECCKI